MSGNSAIRNPQPASLRSWLLAARPKTLPAAIVPVWLGSVLSWWLVGAFSLSLALFTLGSAVAIQVATNFFNDYLDWKQGKDTEARLGPVRMTASGALAPRAVLALSVAMLLLAALLSIPLILARGWPILAIGIPSLYFAFGYTGGPLPLAYRGLGEFFVLLFFGWVAVAGTIFVQSGAWFWPESLLLGSQVGLWSVALIAVNNLRDVDEDRDTGKRTLAVRFGRRFGQFEVITCALAALLLGFGWVALHQAWWPALLPLLLLPLVGLLARGVFGSGGRVLNAELARCGTCLLGFALLWTLGVSLGA